MPKKEQPDNTSKRLVLLGISKSGQRGFHTTVCGLGHKYQQTTIKGPYLDRTNKFFP